MGSLAISVYRSGRCHGPLVIRYGILKMHIPNFSLVEKFGIFLCRADQRLYAFREIREEVKDLQVDWWNAGANNFLKKEIPQPIAARDSNPNK
jgi:hypothetical protein